MTFEALIALLEREQFELGAAHDPVQRAYRQGWNHAMRLAISRLRSENAEAAQRAAPGDALDGSVEQPVVRPPTASGGRTGRS
jgi:hypothetical protein